MRLFHNYSIVGIGIETSKDRLILGFAVKGETMLGGEVGVINNLGGWDIEVVVKKRMIW